MPYHNVRTGVQGVPCTSDPASYSFFAGRGLQHQTKRLKTPKAQFLRGV